MFADPRTNHTAAERGGTPAARVRARSDRQESDAQVSVVRSWRRHRTAPSVELLPLAGLVVDGAALDCRRRVVHAVIVLFEDD